MATWLYEPPTVKVKHSIDNGCIDSEPFGIRFSTLLGVTVYRINGVWKSKTTPPPEEYQAADTIFWGGHQYMVDDETKAELTAAGLWTSAPSTGFSDIFTDEFLDTFGVPTADGGSTGGVFTDTFSDTF